MNGTKTVLKFLKVGTAGFEPGSFGRRCSASALASFQLVLEYPQNFVAVPKIAHHNHSHVFRAVPLLIKPPNHLGWSLSNNLLQPNRHAVCILHSHTCCEVQHLMKRKSKVSSFGPTFVVMCSLYTTYQPYGFVGNFQIKRCFTLFVSTFSTAKCGAPPFIPCQRFHQCNWHSHVSCVPSCINQFTMQTCSTTHVIS